MSNHVRRLNSSLRSLSILRSRLIDMINDGSTSEKDRKDAQALLERVCADHLDLSAFVNQLRGGA